MPQTVQAPGGPALEYHGRTGEIYRIFLVDLLFTIVTLGVFRFWAITRMRRYLWSAMRFQGERFEYTGKGGQLFVGFLVAILIVIGVLFACTGIGIMAGRALGSLAGGALAGAVAGYLAILVLALGAVCSAQRYRLGQTLWCGVRGEMEGSAIAYGLAALGWFLPDFVTIGLLGPVMRMRLTAWRLNASRFGNLSCQSALRAAPLYRSFLLPWGVRFVLIILLLSAVGVIFVERLMPMYRALHSVGISPTDDPQYAASVWTLRQLLIGGIVVIVLVNRLLRCRYVVAFWREIARSSRLGPLRFEFTAGGSGLLGLVLGNLAVLLCTVGFGYPIVLDRNARFLSHQVRAAGKIDPATLRQSTLAAPAYAEGMFQALDYSGGLF